MNSNRRPTLKDVAREAGVSHMTVSRVIRGEQVVAAKTAERVRAAVARLGYRPDPALSALAAYRSRDGGGRGSVLAFLDCDRKPYSEVVLEGVREEAALLGYSVEKFLLPLEKNKQGQLARSLYHRGVTGLCFGPSDGNLEFIGWDWDQFGMVSLGALSHRPPMHAVTIDYFYGAVAAMERLRAEGCRRVGLVVAEGLEARTGHRWRGGFLSAGPGGGERRIFGGRTDHRAELERWVRKEKIDGIMTIHPELGRFFAKSKVKIVSLNDSFRMPGVPYLSLDPRHIGAEGVRLLHHLLLRREFGLPEEPKMVALRSVWREEFVGSA